MKRYCQALDLIDDPEKIAAYIRQHERIWPEVAAHIRSTGVEQMQIWRIGTRLFMIMDVNDSFSAERAEALAQANPKIIEWEALMWQYQAATPWADAGQKWVAMEQIFDLAAQP